MIKYFAVTLILLSSILLVIPFSSYTNAASPELFSSSVSKALSAKWWQWLFSIPPSKNPIVDDHSCDVKQSSNFFFLVGTFGGSAERNCTISKNKAIFFPVINIVATLDKNDLNFDTLDKVRKAVNDYIDGANNLKASIDGVSIKNFDSLRALSPPFKLKVPSDNIGGFPAGTYVAISDGFWVALKPLSIGEHTIKFSGSVPSANFDLDVTYHITVK